MRPLLNEEEVEIAVPGEPPLRFPGRVAGDPTLLDATLQQMRQLADLGAVPRAFASWLNSANTQLPIIDREILIESYEKMLDLHQSGRDHIWTYIVRNVTRPLWLSLRRGRPDVLIGNPPWLRYNAMSRPMQRRFREASQDMGIWVGGNVATHQDLSGYFFARCAERYLTPSGRVAFVMPLAAMTRLQYQGFRTGSFGRPGRGGGRGRGRRGGQTLVAVRFDEAWTFDSNVQPLFEVPSCVLFAHRSPTASVLPRTVRAFSGTLPTRDADPDDARRYLSVESRSWPPIAGVTQPSPYAERFKQGATVVPRRLFCVEREDGRLGHDRNAPFVRSRVTRQDKVPWRDVEPLSGQIEANFLHPLLLGESIAPFRLLTPATAIIPWENAGLINSRMAVNRGHPHLAAWLRRAERAWEENRADDTLSLSGQLDYYGKMTSQFPIRPLRVVYAASGTLPAAAIVQDGRAVVEHKLYWIGLNDIEEARFLLAILNSEAARRRIEGLQSEGQFGPRDFDKVIFSLPIPRYSMRDQLHRSLAQAAQSAENIAAGVNLPGRGFKAARAAIRDALRRAGLAQTIDALVERLLMETVL